MKNTFANWVIEKIGVWLTKNAPPTRAYLCDFNRICQAIKPADVLLIEGRNHISDIIKMITQSPWSHAALYIGRFSDFTDPDLQNKIKKHVKCSPSTQLIIESDIGIGTVISSLDKYKDEHIRIARPFGLTPDDSNKVIKFAMTCLARQYDIRHIFDLARFLFPWTIFPRRWRSSLFQQNASQPTKDICSSMIASAFQSIHYPILPLIRKDDKRGLELIRRNPNLFTPSDFDYSPYFSIIKYPIFPTDEKGSYENLPWAFQKVSQDEGVIDSEQE